MRDNLISLLNKGQIDIHLLYHFFLEEGGAPIDIDDFHRLFSVYFNGQPITVCYKILCIKHNVNFLKDGSGNLIKVV